MKRTIVRWAVRGGALLLTALVVGVAVLYLPGVQRALWRRVAEGVEADWGWRVTAGSVRLRPVTGRFEAREVRVGAPDGPPLLAARRVAARWRWWRLLGSPHRVDEITVDGLAWDLTAPRPGTGSGGGSWAGPPAGFAVGRFRVTVPEGRAGGAVLEVEARDLELRGFLSGGALGLEVAGHVALARQGRRLELGRVAASGRLDAGEAVLERLRVEGTPLELSASGRLVPPWTAPGARFRVAAVLPPGRLLAFWDPGLERRLHVRGRLHLDGELELGGAGPVPRLEGRGEGLEVGGLAVNRLLLRRDGTTYTAEVDGAGWGRLVLRGAPGGPVEVHARVEGVPAALAGPWLPELPLDLPGDLRLGGSVDGKVNLAGGVSGISGTAHLTAGWRGGRLELEGTGDGTTVRIARAELRLPGARLGASGKVARRVRLRFEGAVEDAAALLEELDRRGLRIPEIPAPGGTARFSGQVRGPLSRPQGRLEISWSAPLWNGLRLDLFELRARGGMDRIDLSASAAAAGGTVLEASGVVEGRARRAMARWRLRCGETGALAAALGAALPVRGPAALSGRAELAGGRWSAAAEGHFGPGRLGPVGVRAVHLEMDAAPERLELHGLDVELASGSVSVSGTVSGRIPEAEAALRISARELRPDVVAPQLGLPLHGACGLELEVTGPLSAPALEGTVQWTPDQEPALLGEALLLLSEENGRLTLRSERLETAAGPLRLAAEAPLGDVPRPAWLWAGAPGGPVRIRVSGCALEAGPVLAAAGAAGVPIGGRADLEADLRVDPRRPDRPTALVTLSGLLLTTPLGPVRARGPLSLSMADGRVRLAGVDLEGRDTRAHLEGGADLEAGTMQAGLEATLAPRLVQLALPMVRVEGPVTLRASVEGPLASPEGRLELDHRGGRLVLSEPALRISDLTVTAVLENGVLGIEDGSAEVNGGHVDLGGGWDPASGQGVVAELEDVHAVVPPGILTRWNGLVAVEPGRAGRLRIAGDLELVEGMWDTPFDLLAAMAGSGATPVAVDDPLERIDLEVEVAGRSGILVENNLGRFQVLWRRLDVGGTLARPVISGRVELLPGGRIRVGARELAIVRGSVELPPVPGAEPELNVLTRDPAVSGGGLRTLALGDLVQAGAAASVGRIFGLEATAIEPVRVAAETETDPAGRFTLGRRLGPHLSYFFSTNLTDTQDQTQVIQVGEWRALPGLYAQWISSTSEGDGWAVLERLRWGGSPREAAGGDRLRKVRLEGDWPVAKWRLVRALGMSRGQRWEPFLAFAASVRLERELAAYGYPEARVRAEVTGAFGERVLHLRCEPDEPLHIRWEGDRVPAAVRRRVTALYSPAVPAAASREAMRLALQRELAVRGFPWARVEVAEDAGGGLVVRVERGERLELDALVAEGVPPETAAMLERWWSSPADMMALLAGRKGATRRLLRLLEAEGFPGARVAGVRLAPRGRHHGVVVVRIEPGPRRKVAGVRLEGDDPLGVVSSGDFPLQPGAALRRSVMEAARRRILARYRESGYPEVRVRIGVGGAAGEGVVRIALEPGVRRVVSGVRFSGLHHLNEKVLRKGVALRPGEPLKESAVDETLAALATFPPVEEVTVSPVPGEGEWADVTVTVRERPRWTVGLGARFSSDRGRQILFELDDEDMLGRGISGRFRLRWGSSDRSAQLLLGVPPPPGGAFHLAFSSTFTHTERGDLTERDGLVTVEGWFQHGVRDQLRFYLQQRRAHIYETEPDPFFPLDVTVTIASVGAEVITDRRDDPLDPRHGWFFSCNTAYSGTALGSDLPALRSVANLSWAFEPRPGWTLAQGVRLGAARALKGDLDRTLRFFTGGETSIRGFDQDWVGPVDCFLGRCHPAGGGALLVLNQELRVRLGSRLRGVLFVDAGQVWDTWSDAGTDLSVGLGAGVRFATPLGPIRFDLALPVAHKGPSSGLHAYLGIGQVF